MNWTKAEKWISRELDGELAPQQRVRLEQHLNGCVECYALKEEWVSYSSMIGQKMAVEGGYTATQLWSDVRSRLHAEEKDISPVGLLGMRRAWAGATLGVILAVGLTLFFMLNNSFRHDKLSEYSGVTVEWVETDMPEAMSMVYEHDETGLTVIWIVENNNNQGGHIGS
ncbi:MAG: hypothetical protein GKR87_02410 [Kiritimatiellae bacterium]|nr:hypothetical protein [Kiritimatiellia bacterium]